MGVPAALIGGALLGVTLAGLNKQPDYGDMSRNQAIQYQNAVDTIPTQPQAPVAEDGTKSDAILAAEEEERQRRAAEAQANKTNYTGGLGVTSPPNVTLKQLLG